MDELISRQAAIDAADDKARDRQIYDKGKMDVLDKIRAEIEDTLYVDSLIFGEMIDFKNGKISADDVIEEFNRVTRIEVLKIIDKYTSERSKWNE